MEPYFGRRDDFGADVLSLIDQGRMLAGTDYVNAQRFGRKARRQWAELWRSVDVIFTPTAPILAPFIGQAEVKWNMESEDVRLATTRLVRAINVLGLPALSIPLTPDPLPIGLQIIGPLFQEHLVLAVGAALG